MENLTVGQYDLVYNAFSFGFATLAAATIFFWLGRSQVTARYKTALTITGLVTFIAAYHYFRIFESWSEAYEYVDGTIQATGTPFNDAYRYVDWLLTVPLLLIELILVMGLSRSETLSRATRLGVLAALMVALGYPGEIASTTGGRWLWGGLSMIPFLWIIYELFVGLSKSIAAKQGSLRAFQNSYGDKIEQVEILSKRRGDKGIILINCDTRIGAWVNIIRSYAPDEELRGRTAEDRSDCKSRRESRQIACPGY